MHHLRSTSDVLHFRLAALLLFAICLLAPVAAGLFLQSALTNNIRLTIAGSGVAILGLGLAIPQLTAGSRTSCPLCWTPVLSPRTCAKHRRAKKLMGSHRLRVAMSILLKNHFRCPYCNESTDMTLPNTCHRVSGHWSQLD